MAAVCLVVCERQAIDERCTIKVLIFPAGISNVGQKSAKNVSKNYHILKAMKLQRQWINCFWRKLISSIDVIEKIFSSTSTNFNFLKLKSKWIPLWKSMSSRTRSKNNFFLQNWVTFFATKLGKDYPSYFADSMGHF